MYFVQVMYQSELFQNVFSFLQVCDSKLANLGASLLLLHGKASKLFTELCSCVSQGLLDIIILDNTRCSSLTAGALNICRRRAEFRELWLLRPTLTHIRTSVYRYASLHGGVTF
jgi:hypothetical protein